MKAQDHGIPTRRTCTCTNTYCAHHQHIRAQWQHVVDADQADCWRCGNHIHPTQPWDLGHVDGDPTRYQGPECRPCNRSTSTRRNTRNWNL